MWVILKNNSTQTIFISFSLFLSLAHIHPHVSTIRYHRYLHLCSCGRPVNCLHLLQTLPLIPPLQPQWTVASIQSAAVSPWRTDALLWLQLQQKSFNCRPVEILSAVTEYCVRVTQRGERLDGLLHWPEDDRECFTCWRTPTVTSSSVRNGRAPTRGR